MHGQNIKDFLAALSRSICFCALVAAPNRSLCLLVLCINLLCKLKRWLMLPWCLRRMRLPHSKETLSWSHSFLQQQKCHPVSKLYSLLYVFSSNHSRPADSLKLPSVSCYTLAPTRSCLTQRKCFFFSSQINHHNTVTVISQSPPLPSWSFHHCPQQFKRPPHQEDRGEGIVREPGMGMYTLLYLKWTTSKDLQYSTGNSARYHVAAWM